MVDGSDGSEDWPNAHVEMLQTCLVKDPLPRWGARDPNALAKAVGVSNYGQIPAALQNGAPRQTYGEVLAFVSAEDTPIELAAVSIFAWGGMRRPHAISAFGNSREGWLQVCSRIKAGNLDRYAAYKDFLKLRANKSADRKLRGVGPAYWTKLIHFLMPRASGGRPPGYILDQWAGASINLIFGNVVKMDRSSGLVWKKSSPCPVLKHSASVSELTTSADYENFCIRLECIAQKLGCSTTEIDCAFMSLGQGDWRDYLERAYIAVNGRD